MDEIIKLAFQQGIWCVLFVYLFHAYKTESREDKKELMKALDKYNSALNKISRTLETINDRIEVVEKIVLNVNKKT